MSSAEFLRRLSASFFQSAARWEIHSRGNGRVVIKRDELVRPLFSPLWFLGLIFVCYIGWVTNTIIENGLRGTVALLAPLLATIFIIVIGKKSSMTPVRLEFSKPSQALTIIESDSQVEMTRILKYTEIASLALIPPPIGFQTRATDIIAITTVSPDFHGLQIESIGEEAKRIHAAIDSELPSRIFRRYGSSIQ